MKISTEIYSTAKIVGEQKAVEYIAKAGFDAWDFSMFKMAKMDWQTMPLQKGVHPLDGSDAIRFAMEHGDFYASEGPRIDSLRLEGYTLKMTCLPCERITVSTQMRACQCKNGNDITSAEFDLTRYFDLYKEAKEKVGQETYFRLTVRDKEGRNAYTRAFFIKDLLKTD